MGSEWVDYSLTDLYEISSGLSKPAEDFGEGHPFLSFKDVFYHFFLPDELTQLVRSTEKEREKGSIKRGDVFLTRTSETMEDLGMSSVARKSYPEATFNGFSKRLRPFTNIPIHPEFVGYFLRSPKFRSEMLAFSTMSTRASLNNDMIGRLRITLPPLSEQKAIAHILGSLDDKIELNRRMNGTLEGMAQALFKSWFVDFDPVIDNALAAGNPIPDELADRAEVRRQALADGTANREAAKAFPAAFKQTDSMGWIPEGWEVKKIGQILRSVSDTYPLKNVDGVIFLNTGDILDGRFLHENFSETKGLPGQAKKSIRKNDILYSEIRPKNRRFAFVHFEGAQHVVSTKLMVLRAIGDISSIFAYLMLKQDSMIDHLQMLAESRSGTFPQITFDILSRIEVVLPKEAGLVEAFTEKILQPSFEKQLKNDTETETLTKLRDTLLPKLISGELSIPTAEKLTEEVLS